jgi:hypothetical protein
VIIGGENDSRMKSTEFMRGKRDISLRKSAITVSSGPLNSSTINMRSVSGCPMDEWRNHRKNIMIKSIE